MHPGPMNRGVEIDTLIADGAQSLIREQVEMGVAVRMAVLEALARNCERMRRPAMRPTRPTLCERSSVRPSRRPRKEGIYAKLGGSGPFSPLGGEKAGMRGRATSRSGRSPGPSP